MLSGADPILTLVGGSAGRQLALTGSFAKGHKRTASNVTITRRMEVIAVCRCFIKISRGSVLPDRALLGIQ